MLRLDYLSCFLTVVATILVGRKMWTGLVVSGVNSLIVCVIGLHTSQYGFIPANVFCICINVFNLRAWLKVQKNLSESTNDASSELVAGCKRMSFQAIKVISASPIPRVGDRRCVFHWRSFFEEALEEMTGKLKEFPWCPPSRDFRKLTSLPSLCGFPYNQAHENISAQSITRHRRSNRYWSGHSESRGSRRRQPHRKCDYSPERRGFEHQSRK